MALLLKCYFVASLVAVASAAIGIPIGLPNMPAMPTRPTMPSMPSMPSMPNLPSFEDFANMADFNDSSIKLPQIMYFPDDNGDPVPGKIYGNATQEPVFQSDVFFKLYTKNGPLDGELIVSGDVDSLRRSRFNASHHTYFVTHGFVQSSQAETVQSIKNMYLGFHEGNVIAIDWSAISQNWLYFIVRMQLSQVAQFVANFATFLMREGGVDPSKMHLIGHSLGAHVVGITGKHFYSMVGRKVGRITGLDPAGPLFTVLDSSNRIDRSDADFVDVIHTCGGWLGMVFPVGHVDFYPNGGYMRQPGCSYDFVTAGMCSHSRSWEFFAESINSHRFLAQKCSTYVHYKTGSCPVGHKIPMGQHTHRSASGNYFLKTSDNTPFAVG
ncbi:phospholipase A1-like [Ischnura elegans]|uniref:phospholipase A1-like n=1 Tax=Ischnura elegans TaxID=197161 RepID=UPI001ED8A26B|nr:phospholipase A1-like [Ischnura elegans]